MSEEQVFEFRGISIIHFRVLVTEKTLIVSTHRKKGGDAERTWILRLDNVAEVRVGERIGSRTRNLGLHMKPKHGDVTYFGWLKSTLGASKAEGKICYAAAVAALRALAAQNPDIEVTYGPLTRGPLLIGSIVGAIFGLYLVIPTGEPLSPLSIGVGALTLSIAAISVLRSGVFAKRRRMRASEAADLLEEHGAKL